MARLRFRLWGLSGPGWSLGATGQAPDASFCEMLLPAMEVIWTVSSRPVPCPAVGGGEAFSRLAGPARASWSLSLLIRAESLASPISTATTLDPGHCPLLLRLLWQLLLYDYSLPRIQTAPFILFYIFYYS